jgi:hypothetical protein
MDFGDDRSYFNEMFVALLMITDNNGKINGGTLIHLPKHQIHWMPMSKNQIRLMGTNCTTWNEPKSVVYQF